MCVTGDTLVLTSNGYCQVGDLVDEVFSFIVGEETYDPIGYGFSSTGNKNVIKIELSNGSYLKATEDHKLLTVSGWVRLDELKIGDELQLSDDHENGTIVDIEYVGCFYVYDCPILGYDRYVSEGGFLNKVQ